MESNSDLFNKRRKSGTGSRAQEMKQRRNEGKPYINKKNILVPGKVEPTCEVTCKCTYTCKSLGYVQRKTLFRDFYSVKDNEKQNSYLMGLLGILPIQRRRHGQYTDPALSRRQSTISFTLPDGGGNVVRVCKKTFMEVFGISRRRIETLVKAKKLGNVVYIEKRGNKSTHRKYSVDDETLVIAHVNSFPTEESHYGRQKSAKVYLSQDLNISRLYSAFKEQYPNSKVTYRFYFQVFKNKFPGLKFHRPRTDTCETCDLLTAQTKADPNNKILKQKLALHHLKARRAMNIMKEDHIHSQLPSSDTCTFSVDLQQVLSLPALTHGPMYYLRQLSCYNLCVHLGDINKGHMFLWHEGLTGRGGNEIASCVFKALSSCITTEKKKLTIWSDNCVGQNKNKMMLFLWVYLTTKNYFDEINHKFLISGHSFLSCDRDFAQIEKRKRVKRCEIPLDLVKVIVSATPNNPFTATVMNREDFYDFKAAADKTITTSKMQISTCHWIQVKRDNPGFVKLRSTLNNFEAWRKVYIFRKNVTPETVKSLILPPLHCENRISEEKRKDIRQMLPFLKPENVEFFESLF